MKLQLIVPMSGQGSRFARVGYQDPKPLIKVHGRPMIEWVLRMFPGEEKPLFICRNEHLEHTEMKSILQALKPEGQIAAIEGAKLGPVAALMAAADRIDDDIPALVTYCDYYMSWDYPAFLEYLSSNAPDGAIPCYTGFHPHLVPTKNLYACCRVDAESNLIEIREKHTFEADKTKALHSPGVYYFGSGRLLKAYCTKLMNAEDALNGEYYVSMTYNRLVKDGLKVTAPANLEYFCQWGTPEDLSEYLYWNSIVKRRAQ